MDFRQQRAHRRALALESLDPAQPVQHRACLVHAPTVAVRGARVCAGIVSKGIRFLPAVARNSDLELGEARAAIDRGESAAALKRLDRARRAYAKRHDADGLEHVLDMTPLVEADDDRVRIGRENLAYAVKQNLRQESRRAARERRASWDDPYPDLQAPSEHTGLVLGRGVKAAIGVGVLLTTAIVLAIFVVPWVIDSDPAPKVTLRLLNDTERTQTIRGCAEADCVTSWMETEVPAGLEADRDVAAEELVTLFRLERAAGDLCLPVRVHDGYVRLDGGAGALAVRLSRATPCPGTTVLPAVAQQTGL